MRAEQRVDELRSHALALLIKRGVHASQRGWCANTPLMVARWLIAQGVTLPPPLVDDEQVEP
jgi:hypothetical protein